MDVNSTAESSIPQQLVEPVVDSAVPSTSESPSIEKPSVLIIGGLGYIGRFLARYIHENKLASEVRLVDKQLPELAWLAPEFSEACGRDKFMQADASREQSLARIFTRPAPNAHKQYDYCFNCGGETRYSQPDDIYRLRSHALSLNIGRECARRNISIFVELSTGQVYKPDRQPRKENDKCKPWLRMARWKLQAEADLATIKGLNCTILRLANVYGPYASGAGLSTAMCMARVYESEAKEMRWLWDKELRTNTVHVEDVARGVWHAAEWYTKQTGTYISWRPKDQEAPQAPMTVSPPQAKQNGETPVIAMPSADAAANADDPAVAAMPAPSQIPAQQQSTASIPITATKVSSLPLVQSIPAIRPIPIFNIVDHSSTSQIHLSNLLSTQFSITSTFAGTLLSTFARLNLDSVVADANEELLDPWAELLKSAGITRPGPISPFMERELLGDKEMSLDGGEFERRTGFVYKHEKLSIKEVQEMVESYTRMGWWP